MGFEGLDNREKKILKALIDHYIATAEPVGSRTIAKKYDIGLSSASIRNTLKDLEDMGLVDQPHTSAGRVPTDSGYRIYVDYLLTPEKLTPGEEELIRQEMISDYTEIAQLLEQTSKMLGDLSSQLGVTITTKFDQAILSRLELIPVADRKMMVVLVVKSGLVKSILFEVETSLSGTAINETSRVLNEHLCGLSLGEIKKTIRQRVKDTGAGDPKLIKLFIDSADEIWNFPTEENLHYSGTSNLFQHPEFKNPDNMAEVIELIEDRQHIHELLAEAGVAEGIAISIGRGDKKGKTDQLALLTSSYHMGGIKGVVGIIGPKRMKYSKLVSLVDYTARMLTKILSE